MKPRIILLLAALLFTACSTGSADQGDPSLDQDAAIPGATQTSTPEGSSAADDPFPWGDLATPQADLPEDATQLANLAIQDLAQRQRVDPDDITIVFYEEVVWPDASLGCPEEGIDYAQVITPGYLFILSHEAGYYEYHAAFSHVLVQCQVNQALDDMVERINSMLQDGGPNQPKEWGEVDTSRLTPIAPIK